MEPSEHTLLASITKLTAKLSSMENKLDKFAGDLRAVRTKADLLVTSIGLVQQEQVLVGQLLRSGAVDSSTLGVGDQIGLLTFAMFREEYTDDAPVFDEGPIFDEEPLFDSEPASDPVAITVFDALGTCSTKCPSMVDNIALTGTCSHDVARKSLLPGALQEFMEIVGTGVLVLLGMVFDTCYIGEDGCGCRLELFHEGFGLFIPTQAAATTSKLTNHGIDGAVIQRMKGNTTQFFSLPLDSKKTVAVRGDGFEGYGHHYTRTSATAGDKLDWAESVILVTQPVEDRNMKLWPANPPTFRDALETYSADITNLTRQLVSFMAADLNVAQDRRRS